MVHKTTITVVILHREDEPSPGSCTLEQIAGEIENGDWLGSWEVVEVRPVPESEVEQECVRLGNDGTFFDL